MKQTIEQRAAQFSELEISIRDIADMAMVCRVLMERYQDEARDLESEQFSKKTAIDLLQMAAEPLTFCVHHLDGMARQLRASYDAEPKKVEA